MTRWRTCAAVVLVAGFLAACGTPRERSVVGEIPPGPGLLTGEKGAFVIGDKDE